RRNLCPVKLGSTAALNECSQSPLFGPKLLTHILEPFKLARRRESAEMKCHSTECIQKLLVFHVQSFPKHFRRPTKPEPGADLRPINRAPASRRKKILLLTWIAKHIENPQCHRNGRRFQSVFDVLLKLLLREIFLKRVPLRQNTIRKPCGATGLYRFAY